MSKANRIALQQFLNAHLDGLTHKLAEDGVVGPRTKDAILRVFTNRNAPPITRAEIVGFAASLGVQPYQLQAFATVESNGAGYLRSGLPKILWERHYFWRRLRIRIPLVSDPAPGGYTLDSNRNGLNDSWEKLLIGCERDPVAAFESASWGKFQIMGAHWKALGYPSPFHFAYSHTLSESGHYKAFVKFIQANRLAQLLRQTSTDPNDNIPLVRRYNGPGFRKNAYHIRLANAIRTNQGVAHGRR